MLDMGFIPDIEQICKLLPMHPTDAVLFSHHAAGNPAAHQSVPPSPATRRGRSARHDSRQHSAAGGTGAAEAAAKRAALRDLLRSQGELKNAIIFSNRKTTVAVLEKSLVKHGFNVAALHGDMDQRARIRTLDAFRAGKITYLIASDVAARGLDIPDVSHVFIFDVPVHAGGLCAPGGPHRARGPRGSRADVGDPQRTEGSQSHRAA